MDARLIAVINRLGEDLGNLEKALTRTRELLKELVKEARKNGTQTSTPQTEALGPAKRYIANQQPHRDGTYPRRAWQSYRENDDAD